MNKTAIFVEDVWFGGRKMENPSKILDFFSVRDK